MQDQFADQRVDYGKKIAEIKSDMVELKWIVIKTGVDLYEESLEEWTKHVWFIITLSSI